MSNNTSRVFETARKMKARLIAQEWPAHPSTNKPPQVTLIDADPDGESEIVQILPVIGEDGSIEWKRMPNGRDEAFDVDVVISALDMRGDLAEDKLLDRLEVLTDVGQRAFYDDRIAMTSPTEAMQLLDIAEGVKLEGINQVSFRLVPAGDDVRGTSLIRYRVVFRI